MKLRDITDIAFPFALGIMCVVLSAGIVYTLVTHKPIAVCDGIPLCTCNCECGDACACGKWFEANEFLEKHVQARRLPDGTLQARFAPNYPMVKE